MERREQHIIEERNVTAPEAPLHHRKEEGGILHDIKEGVKEGVNKVADVFTTDNDTPKYHTKEAKRLGKKADDILDDTGKDFKKAEKAQHKADKEAFKANEKTAKALNKQQRGQECLAQAGAEMQQAGAQMQNQAFSNRAAAPFNVHEQGEVRQKTCVETLNQGGQQWQASQQQRHIY